MLNNNKDNKDSKKLTFNSRSFIIPTHHENKVTDPNIYDKLNDHIDIFYKRTNGLNNNISDALNTRVDVLEKRIDSFNIENNISDTLKTRIEALEKRIDGFNIENNIENNRSGTLNTRIDELEKIMDKSNINNITNILNARIDVFEKRIDRFYSNLFSELNKRINILEEKIEEFNDNKIIEWNSNKYYKKNSFTIHKNNLYISLLNHQFNQEPLNDKFNWLCISSAPVFFGSFTNGSCCFKYDDKLGQSVFIDCKNGHNEPSSIYEPYLIDLNRLSVHIPIEFISKINRNYYCLDNKSINILKDGLYRITYNIAYNITDLRQIDLLVVYIAVLNDDEYEKIPYSINNSGNSQYINHTFIVPIKNNNTKIILTIENIKNNKVYIHPINTFLIIEKIE